MSGIKSITTLYRDGIEVIASGHVGSNRRVDVGSGGGLWASFTSDKADEHARLFIEVAFRSKPPDVAPDAAAQGGKEQVGVSQRTENHGSNVNDAGSSPAADTIQAPPPDAGLSDEAIVRGMAHAYESCPGDFDESLQAAVTYARQLLAHRAVTLPERDALARIVCNAEAGQDDAFDDMTSERIRNTWRKVADAVIAELRKLNAHALGSQ